MWDQLFLSAMVACLFLYAPGYVALRAFRFARIVSVVCAPLVTIAAYSILPIVYEKLGVACSWAVIVVPVFAAAVLVFAIARPVGRRKALADADSGNLADGRVDTRLDWAHLGLYVVVGIVVVTCVFMGTFDNARSFVQEFDNIHHLSSIRAFVESGVWSSLSSTLYPPDVTAFPPPFTVDVFYPSAWHCLAALVVEALGAPVALAANAINFVFCAVILPSSMFLFVRTVFGSTSKTVLFTAFCVLAFVAYPWRFLAWGPLLPNLAAFALLPAVLCCFVLMMASGSARRMRIAFGVLFMVGFVDLAFTQPNAVFTAGVLLVPFCLHWIACQVEAKSTARGWMRRMQKATALGAFIVFVVVVWVAVFNAPFVQDVVSYSWPACSDVPQALANVVLQASKETVAQIALAVVVAIGFVYVLFNRAYRWVAFSYALMCALSVVAVSLDGPVKQLLTGFWYTDVMRLAAGAVIVAVPLAGAGLSVVYSAILAGAKMVPKRETANGAISVICAGVLVCAFMVANYFPGHLASNDHRTSAFSSDNNFLGVAYSLSGPKVYGWEEIEFINRVKEVIGPEALILNEPNDGSAFAYGDVGLNVYERYLTGWGGETESEESQIIRRSLDMVASDPSVAEAVRAVGAEYVMQLDQNGKHDGNHFLFSYDSSDWFGIDRIDDETPGFEIVLADGDMRLYRIVLPDEA